MKATKIMLAVIATFLITWLVIGTIGWLLSDLSLKESMTHGGTLMILMLVGWIPAVIVGADINEQLKF